MNINQLRELHSIPERVEFETWRDFSPAVRLRAADSEMLVSLYGGQLLSCRIGQQDLFWLSPCPFTEIGKAIRGGVPILFPWFGPSLVNDDHPSHGFARTSFFKVNSTSTTELTTTLELSLSDSEESLKLWPYRFELTVRFKLGLDISGSMDNQKGASVELEVKNTAEEAFSWSGGLHSYFSVANARNSTVDVPSQRYFDNLSKQIQDEQRQVVSFAEEVDRVYLQGKSESGLNDSDGNRELKVKHSGHDSVVVWNPGPGSKKSDMPSSEEFICVETTCGAAERVIEKLPKLKPGQTAALSFTSWIFGTKKACLG